MRVGLSPTVAPAVIALLLPFAISGCDDVPDGAAPWVHDASEDELTTVVDGIGNDDAAALARVGGAPGIVRTPEGATLLWWSLAGMEGERTASAWMTFSPDGKLTASQSLDQFSPADPAAYDGGFLTARPGGDAPAPVVVSATGGVTTPRTLGTPRPARAGDVLLGGHSSDAFRPSNGTFAPLPVANRDALGGMMPTAIDGSGAITSVSGTVRKPVLLYSPDGGATWEHKAIELPPGVTINAERLFTSTNLTLLPLVTKTQEPAGWITRSTDDKQWTVTTFDPDFEDSWVMGLVGDRVLIGSIDDHRQQGGTLVTLANTWKRTKIRRNALRAAGGKLYSMSPKVTESVDGKTWMEVPLQFPKG